MATSGSFTTSSRSATQYPRNATFSWTQKSQSTANNETVIDWSFTLGGGSSSTASIAIYTGSITVNGTTHNFSYGGAFKKNGFVLKSGTTTIKHNDDGTKNFSASGGVNIYGSSEYYSGSGSFTLNSIPRKATVTSASNFNDEANPTIGYENKAGNSVSSLQACIAKTDGSTIVVAYRDINKTGSSYTFNLTAAERTALRNLIPNSNSTTVRMYVKTVIGSNTFYDYKEVTLSITNANPTFSNFTYQDTNSTVTNIIGSNQILVRGKSSLRVTVSSGNKAVANKSATMSNYVASISGLTASANYSTSDVTMNFSGNTFTAGTQALSVKATDSRGNSTTVSKNVTVLAYSNPTTNISAQRLNNFENQTTITVGGSFSPLTVSGTAKNTISLVEYRYKDQSTTTWGSWTTMSGLSVNSGGTFTVSNLTLSLDNTKSFDFQVRTTDRFGNYTTSAVISQGTAIFRIGTDGYVYNQEQRCLSTADLPITSQNIDWATTDRPVFWRGQDWARSWSFKFNYFKPQLIFVAWAQSSVILARTYDGGANRVHELSKKGSGTYSWSVSGNTMTVNTDNTGVLSLLELSNVRTT